MEDARLFIWFHVTQSSWALWYRLSLSETYTGYWHFAPLGKLNFSPFIWFEKFQGNSKCFTNQGVIERGQRWVLNDERENVIIYPPVISFPCKDSENVSFRKLQIVCLLTHPVHSSLASLKTMGSEPFFTLAGHTAAHTHT